MEEPDSKPGAPPPDADANEPRSPKILCVEDNPGNRQLLHSIFKTMPTINFFTEPSAEDGIETAIAEVPDLILMDINLPGMNGYEATKVLKATTETAHIPVIALTAAAMKEDIERAEGTGFTEYLTKPIDIRELISVVNKVLDNT